MEAATLRRSRRIKSLSDDEASVASSTRSREQTPRKSTVTRAIKSIKEKEAKEKRLGAIPEVIGPAGAGSDLEDGTIDKTRKVADSETGAKGKDVKKDGKESTSTKHSKTKSHGKQSTSSKDVTSVAPTSKEVSGDAPTLDNITEATSKPLGKNALKKLQRMQGINVQQLMKAPASPSTKQNNSQKRKKRSEDQVGAGAAADVHDTTSSSDDKSSKVASKKKRTKVFTTEPTPKIRDSPKKNAPTGKASDGDGKSEKLIAKTPNSPPPTTKSSKPLMDVKVHRMRFLKLQQRAILSMSSTPLPSSSSSSSADSTLNRHKLCHPVRLAISREGGSVELLSPHDRWVSVGDIPGVRGREVDAMVWICGTQRREKEEDDTTNDGEGEDTLVGSYEARRCRLADEKMHLFGCSRDGTIFELDFATKRQKGVIGSGGGGVFCMTSLCSRGGCCCPQMNDESTTSWSCGGYFAAGCEDGTVKIFTAFGSTSGGPTLVATLPSAGNAILSLAWLRGHSGRDDGGMGGSVLFAGVADGTIRRFDCTTSITSGPISTGSTIALSKGSVSVSYRWKSSLRMTVENRGLREATKVWALEALTDGTVISGDSLGHIQIWDGASGTMTQSFDHNENGADVLCLAISEDENKIFASGIDSSVRCIERQAISESTGVEQDVMVDFAPVRKWISSISHRKHSHDVKALAVCHKDNRNGSKPLELLVSGSVDTRICSYVTNDFKASRPKVWYNWPSRSPISISRKQRLLAVTRDNRIDLYRFDSTDMVDPSSIMCPESRDESKCLVKTISITSPYNMCCSTISDDGKFLAASDALSLYVFSLDVEVEDGVVQDVLPTKLGLSGVCKHPATALKFDDNDRLVCATADGPINILKISSALKPESSDSRPYTVSLEHAFKDHTVDWSRTSHHFPIINLDLSSDGKWLSAGRFSSDKGSVHVFTLSTNDGVGRYQHWWGLPESDAPTTCVKFLGGCDIEASLAVGCSTNEFYIFNLDRRALSHWSNDMGLPLLKSLPKELTTRSEPVTRILSNPAAPQCFILVSGDCFESCILVASSISYHPIFCFVLFQGSHGYFCVVNLDQPVPERSTMFPPDHLRASRLQPIKADDTSNEYTTPKRKSKKSAGCCTNFTVCLRYNEMIYQGFVAENEMVVVEEPWMSILEELPDALARRVYGM